MYILLALVMSHPMERKPCTSLEDHLVHAYVPIYFFQSGGVHLTYTVRW